MSEYLLIDIYSDYKNITNYKGLKQLLIDELIRETKNYYNEYEVVSSNADIFGKLSTEDFTSLDFIIEQLEGFGWKVIDLLELERDLEDIKQYFSSKDEYVGFVDGTIDLIRKGGKQDD